MKKHFSIIILFIYFFSSVILSQTLDVQQLYKKALPSLVTINVTHSDGSTSVGSGFMAVNEGILITAWHVVEKANKITAHFSNGEEFEIVSVVDKDEIHDICLLQIKTANRPILKLNNQEPKIGEKVVIIGTPKGLEFVVSDGIISQVQNIDGSKQYQFTCPASPGNSGGPLLNSKGEVIGIVSWQVKEGQNLNFAIPSFYAQALNPTIRSKPYEENPEKFELKTQGDSVSYAIGQNIFQNLTDPFLQMNFNVLIKSIQDAMSGKSDMTQEKVMEVLTALNKRGQERQAAMQKAENEKKKVEMAPIIEKNKKDGEAFLAENKNKEGVKTTASGLQYKVLVSGTGPSPKDTSKVKVHYAGKLLDGKEFDSSYKRNQPAEFPLNQVIKGWTEGLQLMHVGDKFEFYIPYQLAYGEEGKGETIPPASVLIFEVELLDIVK